jgi:DNA repair exonuclease SbcCD ATPase subunit
MTIPENVKLVGLVALLGGVGTIIYKSATQSDRLKDAIEDIRHAQTLISSSIKTIESAKTDISEVRQELKTLQDLAVNTRKDLEILRQERVQLEKTVKETLKSSREVMREQRELVEDFMREKKQKDAAIDSIPRPNIIPLSQIK